MSGQRTIVVAVEDFTTAGAVAAEAVRTTVRENATRLVLVHVLDEHTVLNGMMAISGSSSEPVMESVPEGERLLAETEQAIQAEFTALGRETPEIIRIIGRGHVGGVLARITAEQQAGWLVVGARRPHLFGRLTHPDVRSHLAAHASSVIQVAPLQESPSPEPS